MGEPPFIACPGLNFSLSIPLNSSREITATWLNSLRCFFPSFQKTHFGTSTFLITREKSGGRAVGEVGPRCATERSGGRKPSLG